VQRHARGPYEGRSYCYTLEKRVKPFVRNEKGVIGVFEHPRASCNRGSLITERTHINEKRAPKAPVRSQKLSVLSVSFLS
jgi:hypothetical protein